MNTRDEPAPDDTEAVWIDNRHERRKDAAIERRSVAATVRGSAKSMATFTAVVGAAAVAASSFSHAVARTPAKAGPSKATREKRRRTKAARKTNRRGFTVIEGLIVAAIVAILIAVFIPNCQRWQERRLPCVRWEERNATTCTEIHSGATRCVDETVRICVERASQ